MARTCFAPLALVLSLMACGSPAPAADAGPDAAPAPVRCVGDSECDDGLWCNGPERCDPSAAGASARGCVAGQAPCPGIGCDEGSAACIGDCPDADGDGVASAACGGRDCDDGDRDRFPGHVEVCDVDGRDEDCDPATYGFRDLDGDGRVSASCCNGDACGDDCDDMSPSSSPISVEVCDGRDNDCDGSLDEGVFRPVYEDDDGDGYGDPTRPRMAACGTADPGVDNGLDCDDADPAIRPGAAELCDGRDDNCDGLVEPDVDGDGHLAPRAVCTGGTLPRDDCNDLDDTVYPGAPELCDRYDNDCDGAADERADADLACRGTSADAAYCIASACTIGACAVGRGDCDGSSANGCEISLGDDEAHCGACGVRCAFGTTCSDGRCEPVRAVEVDAGGTHACFVTDLGRVGCFGGNGYGQLGDRSRTSRGMAVEVVDVREAVSVDVSVFHSCAVLADGTARCWGVNDFGQLGDGTRTARTTAEPVVALSGTRDLSAADAVEWSCAIDASGAVRCWGFDLRRTVAQANPTPFATGVTGATRLATGDAHHCVLDAAGAARCWGFNGSGQLGDGRLDHGTQCALDFTMRGPPAIAVADCSAAPVPVTGLTGLAQIGAGPALSCARDGRRLWCWGAGGLVGDGGTTVRAAPFTVLDVGAGTTLLDLDVGTDHACAVRGDGRALCWGENSAGQIGDGTSTARRAPVLGQATDLVDVAAGMRFTCGVHADGTISCWGANQDGQLGDRSTATRATPARVAGLDRATALAGTSRDACARTSTGSVVCWGLRRPAPATIAGLTSVAELAGRNTQMCARTHDGAVSCWDPAVGTRATVALDPARAIAVGTGHACAALRSGAVRCWGASNDAGQLGDGTTSPRTAPVEVVGVAGAVQVIAGARHSCARLATGRIACWGANNLGQLGDGTARASLAAVEVAGIDDAIDLVGGSDHACALHATGRVSCWGDDSRGQLGDGAVVSSGDVPRRVIGAADVQRLTAGAAHTCGLVLGGTVRCWGSNDIGQSGQPDGTAFAPVVSATEVPGLTARAIGAGDAHTCAVDLDEGVRCWGTNYEGQAGDLGWDSCEPVGCLPGRYCDAGDCNRESPTQVRGL